MRLMLALCSAPQTSHTIDEWTETLCKHTNALQEVAVPSKWFREIRNSEARADRMRDQLQQLLTDPGLTPEQASQLLGSIRGQLDRIEAMLILMEAEEVSEVMVQAAETAQDAWRDLMQIVLERVKNFTIH